MFTTLPKRKPGETWTDEYGRQTICRHCGHQASVIDHYWDDWRNGLVGFHHRPGNDVRCPGIDAAVDLEAALRRDARLNPAEEAVHDKVFRYLHSCHGFDSLTGEECHHPACDVSRQAGLRWTLMGWRTSPSEAPAVPDHLF